MRLKRRKAAADLTDEEQAKIDQAQAAADRATRALAEVGRRGPEVESLVSWLHRARQENHFALRVRYMIEHPGEETPPWPS